jgi:hypothetical protein
MKVKVTTSGFKQVDSKFARLIRGSTEIAIAAVDAGVSVLVTAAKDAAPGGIDREIGKAVRVDGDQVSGVAGLMQLPQPGQGRGGPYGLFPELGTRHQRPQHLIGRAMTAALPRAMQAAKNAGRRAAQRISVGK